MHSWCRGHGRHRASMVKCAICPALHQENSRSSEGSTQIMLVFELDRDIEGAARDVQAAINQARPMLPSGMSSVPTYEKVNPSSMPIMVLALTSQTANKAQLFDMASGIVQQKLAQIPGVGSVDVGGGSLPAVRVGLNPKALASAGIALDDVRSVINNANSLRPNGYLEGEQGQWQINSGKQYNQARFFEPLVLKNQDGQVIRLGDVAKVSANGNGSVVFELHSGNADFTYVVADYHLVIMPSKDGVPDWQAGVGTGGYRLKDFEPGVRMTLERSPDYWKPGRAHFASAELIAIADGAARVNALVTGQVDVINKVDLKTVALLKRNPNLVIEETKGAQHYTFPMLTDSPVFQNNDVRLAMKHAINRETLLASVLYGYGLVGNDHPIQPGSRFINTSLAQRTYDPDKSRFHLKKAGLDSLKVRLQASDAAYTGAVGCSLVNRIQSRSLRDRSRQGLSTSKPSVTRMSRRFCPCHAGGHAAMARSRMDSESSGTMARSVTSYTKPRPWQAGQAPWGVCGEKSSANSMAWPDGYRPAREYSMRSRLDIIDTEPSVERALAEPRGCCRATAGGRPSMESTSGTPT